MTIALQCSHDIGYASLGDLTWLELQRPGQISSLRGGQTLAKIVARSK